MNPRIIVLACVLCAPGAGAAADELPLTSFAPGLLQATLGLAVVLLLIWGAARLTRWISPIGSSAHSPLKLVATLGLGQRERVVLIECGDDWLLLGVAPGQVSALHKTSKLALPQSLQAGATPFGNLLALARRKREDLK